MMASCTTLMIRAVVLVLMVQNSQAQSREENEVPHSPAQSSEESEKVCLYLGKVFRVGELVTGDACDKCYCTKHGLMCEMVKCPTANCHDKVKGECCYECPHGPNCLYEGENSTVLVTETGCTYSGSVVCYCYHDNKMADKEETMCMPAFPGDHSPPCAAHLP